MEEHRQPQRKKPHFEGKFGADEKVQALKQRFHGAKQTLGLHRNMDCGMLESQYRYKRQHGALGQV